MDENDQNSQQLLRLFEIAGGSLSRTTSCDLKETLLHSTSEVDRPKAKLIKWTPKTTRSLVLAHETMEVLQIRDFYYGTECLVKNMRFLHNWDKYSWAGILEV